MNYKATLVAALSLSIPLALTAPAAAQDQTRMVEREAEPRENGFFEASGAYGFQIGNTEYIPEGTGAESQHPLVNGYAIGGTVGVKLTDGLYAIGNYEFTSAASRDGEIENAVDNVEGTISYHTAVAGLRLTRDIGPGFVFGELAGGVLFPFDTELELEYAAPMSQLGITGTGTRTSNYGYGIGAHGMLGYRFPLVETLYVSTGVKLKAFQSNNDGESVELDNFVTDFTEPMPVNATIPVNNDGTGERPETYSVVDARLQLAIGTNF